MIAPIGGTSDPKSSLPVGDRARLIGPTSGIALRPTALIGCASVTDTLYTRICDIYDFFAPHINVLTYLLTYLQTDGPRTDTSVAVSGTADAMPLNNNNNNNNNNNSVLCV